MKKRQKLLTDEQWDLIEPLFPPPKQRRDKRGRPPAPHRACFEGILWILQAGAAWRFLPHEFPSPSTCWRRLQQWEEEGVWLEAWRTLLRIVKPEIVIAWLCLAKTLHFRRINDLERTCPARRSDDPLMFVRLRY